MPPQHLRHCDSQHNGIQLGAEGYSSGGISTDASTHTFAWEHGSSDQQLVYQNEQYAAEGYGIIGRSTCLSHRSTICKSEGTMLQLPGATPNLEQGTQQTGKQVARCNTVLIEFVLLKRLKFVLSVILPFEM